MSDLSDFCAQVDEQREGRRVMEAKCTCNDVAGPYCKMHDKHGYYSEPKPENGKCCSCGYEGVEETECAPREDKTHCVHWWEGKDGENDE